MITLSQEDIKWAWGSDSIGGLLITIQERKKPTKIVIKNSATLLASMIKLDT